MLWLCFTYGPSYIKLFFLGYCRYFTENWMNFDKKFKARIAYCLQVLTFENFKNRGLVCLSHSNTEHLLDLLEDAQATLALMLTSRHIGPLRDEAAAWAIKLKEISEVLEQVWEKGSNHYLSP